MQSHQSCKSRVVYITKRSTYRRSFHRHQAWLEPLEKRLCLSAISFAPSTDIPNGNRLFNDPASVAVGDFNEDGNQDMVVANRGNGTLTVLYGNGSGGFSDPLSIPVGMQPVAVTVGYFNGDNHLDLAVANIADSTINVIINKGGNAGFDLEHIQSYKLPIGSSPQSLIAADVNNDGRQDLVTANTSGHSVSVLLANPAGGFFSATTSPVTGVSNLRSVAMVQFDADGIPDLAVVGEGSGGGVLKVLKGKGDGTFIDNNTSYSVGNNPFSVAVGYLGSSGSAPFFLAVTNYQATDGHVSVLVGDGKGNTSHVQQYEAGPYEFAIVVGDFNGDGQPDLAVANHDSHSVTVLRGLRSANSTDLDHLYSFTLDNVHEFPVSGEPSSLAVADFNGDHLPDLAVANGPDDSVSLLINNSGPPPNPLVVNTIDDEDILGDNYTSLREAVDYANSHPGSTITFDPTLFATTQTIVLTQGELELTQTGTGNSTTIIGPNAGVIISGSPVNPHRVFQIDAGATASLSGLTITGGSDAPGGGVSNAGALTLTRCIVTGNSAFGAGGGIFNDASGTLRVDASVIRGNTAITGGGGIANAGSLVIVNNSTIGGTSNADRNLGGTVGGGIYNVGSGILNMSMSTTDGNSASDGGGIYYASSSSQEAQILSSTVSGNTATDGDGGGIFVGSPMTITLSTISGNTALNGGGLFNQGFGVTLLGCTVSGNTAGLNGGGIYNTFGTMLTILGGSTIGGPDENTATNGGGIYNAGSLSIDGSTVAGNSATQAGGGLYNDTSSFVTIADSNIGINSFRPNRATDGAGIYNRGYLTVTNGTIRNGLATGNGGGIYNAGILAIAGTDITSNIADSGGGIYNDGGAMALAGVSIFGNRARKSKGGAGVALHGGIWVPVATDIFLNSDPDSNQDNVDDV